MVSTELCMAFLPIVSGFQIDSPGPVRSDCSIHDPRGLGVLSVAPSPEFRLTKCWDLSTPCPVGPVDIPWGFLAVFSLGIVHQLVIFRPNLVTFLLLRSQYIVGRRIFVLELARVLYFHQSRRMLLPSMVSAPLSHNHADERR